jgi:hypothetical protein
METPKSPKFDTCYDPGGANINCEAFTAELNSSDLVMPVTLDQGDITLGSFEMPAHDDNFHCGLAPSPYKNYSYKFENDHLIFDTDGIEIVFAKDDRRPDRLQGLWVAISTSDRRVKAQTLQFIGTGKLLIHSVCR